MTPIEQVLDCARWAPSGDNAQPWRFVPKTEREAEVVGYDTRAHCVYDLDGWASELAHGNSQKMRTSQPIVWGS